MKNKFISIMLIVNDFTMYNILVSIETFYVSTVSTYEYFNNSTLINGFIVLKHYYLLILHVLLILGYHSFLSRNFNFP